MAAPVSAILIVYNQQQLLRAALSSIALKFNEVIVVDLSSTEDINSIAEEFKAKYVKYPRVKIVEEVRQSCLELATEPYVLFLDADETLGQDLLSQIEQLTSSDQFDYFEIPRQNFVFGSWVQASRWWPDYQIRLFKKGSVTWPTILHAPPIALGKGYHFDADPKLAIMHQNYQSLDEWFQKNQRYARADAHSRTQNQDSEFSLLTATRLSVSELISRFYAGEGYRDGMRGVILSILQSFYYFLVYAYYWEEKGYKELESATSIKSFPRKWFSHGLSEVLHWDTIQSSFVKKIKTKLVRKMIA